MKPRALRPGDTVALVSPASSLTADRLEKAIQLLEGNGYHVRLMSHALDNDAGFAGSDEDRAADLQAAFDDPTIAAACCTRGGYGCARLFPYLDLDRIAATRKLFLGFSDITTLHAALNRRGLPSVHAPMALTLGYEREPWVYESFLRALRGENTIVSEAPLGKTVVEGVAEGKLVGGCMCLICDSIATPNELEFENNLLLIEDVDEAPHRVDAMLTHLLNSGRAQLASGFVIGEMTRTEEKLDGAIGGRTWQEIFIDRLAPLRKPMIFNFPFGHAKNMLSLPLGIRARLDADSGSLTYLESLCD